MNLRCAFYLGERYKENKVEYTPMYLFLSLPLFPLPEKKHIISKQTNMINHVGMIIYNQ